MSDKDVTHLVTGGKLRYIERSYDDIPYFRGVKEFKIKDTVVSEFFVLADDVTLQVLSRKWNWKKYLNGLLRFKFSLINGYDFFFEKKTFYGLSSLLYKLDPKKPNGELMKTLGSALTSREPTKAYVLAEAKSKQYDYVFGELNHDYKKIIKIHRVKKLDDKQVIPIIKDAVIDVGVQTVKVKLGGEL